MAPAGSAAPPTRMYADAYALSTGEGGRHTASDPNYRPNDYARTADVTAAIRPEVGVDVVVAGDNSTMNVELISPIAMDEGLNFAIREGGRTVGAGVVTEIVE